MSTTVDWTDVKHIRFISFIKVKNAYYCRHSTWNIVEAKFKIYRSKMSATVRLKGCEYNGNL